MTTTRSQPRGYCFSSKAVVGSGLGVGADLTPKRKRRRAALEKLTDEGCSGVVANDPPASEALKGLRALIGEG
jgi:hypothetical protein